MDSYGDTDDHDDHDDDSGPIISHSIYRSSSDDEDQQEQLMDDNDDGDDDDDVDIGFRSHHRHGWKGKQRFQQRNKRKNEAIYGVFYESKNTASSSTTMNVAPVFVQAKRKKKKEFGLDNVRDSDDKESNIKNLPSFVAAKSSDSDNMKSIQRAEEKDQVDDTETVLQAKQEQEQADQYFWSLLNKARENNHQRIRKRSTSSSSKNEEEISNTSRSINGPNNSNNRYLDVFTAASSTNLETMLPTSFGTNLGNQPSIGIRTNTVMPITKKDPSMAKWEQHTKGIGSKLLAKMGWTGSEVRGIDLEGQEGQEAQRRKKKLRRRKGGDFTKDFDDDDVSNDDDADFTGRAHFNSAMSYHVSTDSLLANQKMETILEIIEKVKDAVGGFTHRQLVQDLAGQQLSPQDQDVLRFWTVLAPTLLRPAIEFPMGVMATDIADKDLKNLRNARWAKAFDDDDDVTTPTMRQSKANVDRKATIVIEHLIQASDIAHTMQHWHVYRKWNERLFTEMYQAFLGGRADKDPSTFWYEGEIGFFDFYIIPLAKKLKDCGVFGISSDEYLNYVLNIREEWERRGKEVVADMMKKMGTTLVANPMV